MLLKRQERIISIIGGLILAGLTLVAGISVYVVMQRQVESLLSNNLGVSLQSNVRLFESQIDQVLSNTRTVSTRPFLIKNLQLLESETGNATGRAELQRSAQSFLPTGFTGFSFYDVRGHAVAHAGIFSQQHDLRIPLKSNNRVFLLWDGQFILHASMDILDQQGRRIGSVMTETNLPRLTRVLTDIPSIGKTSEFAVCASLEGDEKNMDCFPSRISGKVFKRFPRTVEGNPLPMNHALNGETGILFAQDYRLEQVVAAYAPVGSLGLGMVLKIDQAERYHRVTEQLKFIAPLLAALVLVGMLLLNVLVRPLVRKLVDSERETRAANALLTSTQAELNQFKNTLDQTLEAIYIFDPDTLLFTYVNEGAKRQTGYNEIELMQMTPVDFNQPVVALEKFKQLVQPLLTGVQPSFTFQSVQRHKDGHDTPVEVFLQLVRMESQAPRFVAMVTDISERKQAQEEILRLNAELEERVRQRTAQLQAANQELEAFSYSVAHDLRTPISSIDGFSSLLGKEIRDVASERSRHYLNRIRASAVQMGELIDAMLMLAQLSRTTLVWQTLDLSAMAETVLNDCREREPGRATQLDVQPGLVAQGDPRLLRQVLDNLLGNAWKFSGRQPQTRISFGRESGPDGLAVYAVRDQGAGFDMAYADKLFGAFQRLHTVSEFPGTGIGLVTVHRIITRHGGRIWAESVPGSGTTFFFTLGESPPN